MGKRINMIFLRLVGLGTMKNLEDFQDVPFNPLNIGFFSAFFGEIRAC